MFCGGDKKYWIKFPICYVRYVQYSDYTHDIIPDRIYEKVSYLRKIGVDYKQLQVAYPYIKKVETKIGKVELYDPVLVVNINGTLFEADWWE